MKEEVCGFDLPIALALLTATGQLLPDQLDDFAKLGELALDGNVRPVRGTVTLNVAAIDSQHDEEG